MALTAMFAGLTMIYDEPGYARRLYKAPAMPKHSPPPCPELEVKELPKGHTFATYEFVFDKVELHAGYMISVNAEFSYGTKKAGIKKLNLLGKQLERYVANASLKEIESHPRFTVIEIPVSV